MSITVNASADSVLAASPLAKTLEQTLGSVQSSDAESPIIVDFDETLFLRNSTEEYLKSVYPRMLGAAFVLTTKAVKPWRFFPKALRQRDLSKDWFLVVAATILFPWTALVWRWRAVRLAKTYCNIPLAQAIEANGRSSLVIATLGFDWVVKPLIRHLPMNTIKTGRYQLVACRFWQGASDRAKGKSAMVSEAIGSAAVANAVVVTDSDKDTPILRAAKTPCLLQWPDAAFIPSTANVYLPLFYSEKVKNAGQSHCLKQVVLAHWLFLVIASSVVSPNPVAHAAALLLLTLSYWCVYEIGYQENDILGEKFEKKPVLSKTFSRYKSQVSLNTIWPWLWAMAFAIPACVLLSVIQAGIPWAQSWAQLSPEMWVDIGISSGLWLAFLTAVRITFGIYNRLNEEARIWVYPLLQTHKFFGFALLIHISEVGAMLLMALVLSRWLKYCIYRCGGDRKRFPVTVSCLMLFIFLYAGAAVSSPNPESFVTWQAAIALSYCCIRAYGKGRQLWSRIDLVITSKRSIPSVIMDTSDSNHQGTG